MSGSIPTLYSFRRCPYAMRARMALYVSGQECEHREVVLRNKPSEMIALSPKATVPVLEVGPGHVIDESLDIMLWALERNDPFGWLVPEAGTKQDMLDFIARIEDEFKPHLDRYKYALQYENADPGFHRAEAEKILVELNKRLSQSDYLFGARYSLADFAIAPFIRQFANTDRDWFDQLPYGALHKWLKGILASEVFATIMHKYPAWQVSDEPVFSPI